ncbi:MAG: hypothetical protein ABIH11_04820 [Candidatus Altiarchaeota archaeon]
MASDKSVVEPWKCSFCGNTNPPGSKTCGICRSGKDESDKYVSKGGVGRF